MAISGSPRRRKVNPVEEELKSVNAKRLWLDTTSILGLVLGVVMTTWTVSSERNDINARLDRLAAQITDLSDRQTQLIPRVRDRWTKTNMAELMEQWCYKAEQANTSWKCPDFDLQKKFPHSQEDVQ